MSDKFGKCWNCDKLDNLRQPQYPDGMAIKDDFLCEECAESEEREKTEDIEADRHYKACLIAEDWFPNMKYLEEKGLI